MKNSSENGLLLKAEGLSKTFTSGLGFGPFIGRQVRALQKASLTISRGEKIGLIGRSGSGKSTLIRCLAKLIGPDEGQIIFNGENITSLSPRQFKRFRKKIQVIFQNNYSALNPGMKIKEMLRETAKLSGHENGSEKLLEEQLLKVSLSKELLNRYPRELSGGECRRISVAMIDLIGPELLLADEPVTALDYINKWEMMALFERLNKEKNMAFLFATHDLEAISGFVERVIVLYGGVVVEKLPIDRLWEAVHPHTLELVRYHGFLKNRLTMDTLSSYNTADKEGSANPEHGCIFINNCQRFRLLGKPKLCLEAKPSLSQVAPGQFAACHFNDKVVE